ncbi:MAG TPA: aminotransferase class IV [Vicinamibacteria bacterium]|jgi:branched-chain amino acid aminotransferase|nr:aminotransferase class IV [Vicinamibacteria bacterium]
MPSFASVNGEISPADQARVSVLDTGFVFGDGVYETLRTYSGRPFLLDRHLARLRASAARLGFEVSRSDESLAREIDLLLSRAHNPESYIRIIVTRGAGDMSYRFDRVKGPTVAIVVKPFEPLPERYYTEGAPVIISSIRRNHPRALDPAIKSCNLLNSVLSVREAQAAGAVEPILLNDAGDVAEGASSNVFIVKDSAALTPPLSAGILAGVTRALILELCSELGIPAREETLRVADLVGADEVFLTSTIREALPVGTIDGKPVGDGRPGPLTLRILQAVREYARRVSVPARA